MSTFKDKMMLSLLYKNKTKVQAKLIFANNKLKENITVNLDN